MFLTKRSRDKRIKEIEAAINEHKQDIEDMQKVVSELKAKYLPIRNKCVEIINDNSLNFRPLRDVFCFKYENGKLHIVIVDTKYIYWNNHKLFDCKIRNTLLDKTIQLDIPESYNSDVDNAIIYCLETLKGPDSIYANRISYHEEAIDKLKAKLAKLNK